jgi:hypothetical protein
VKAEVERRKQLPILLFDLNGEQGLGGLLSCVYLHIQSSMHTGALASSSL